jgi:hypothetical protein
MNPTLNYVLGITNERPVQSSDLVRGRCAVRSDPFYADEAKFFLLENAKDVAANLTLAEAAELAAVLTEVILDGCKK